MIDRTRKRCMRVKCTQISVRIGFNPCFEFVCAKYGHWELTQLLSTPWLKPDGVKCPFPSPHSSCSGCSRGNGCTGVDTQGLAGTKDSSRWDMGCALSLCWAPLYCKGKESEEGCQFLGKALPSSNKNLWVMVEEYFHCGCWTKISGDTCLHWGQTPVFMMLLHSEESLTHGSICCWWGAPANYMGSAGSLAYNRDRIPHLPQLKTGP